MVEGVARYEILEELGRGGFAVVYRAHDRQLDRLVALKELRPMLLTDPDSVKDFRQEARNIARLDHPNVVTIYDVYEAQQRLFIVMQLVDGSSLAELVATQGHLSWAKAVEVFTALAAGLDYAHTRGILHRDLKPANILLDTNHGPMLSDFGLAKLIGEAGTSVTAGGIVVGTPHYIAPEVWEGKGTTRQSDIYALGCILYEMLMGEKLFPGETPPATMMAHLKALALPRTWPEGVPSDVADVLTTALAQKPADRYAAAGEMAQALTTLVKSEPVTPLLGPTRPETGWVSSPILTTKLYIPPTRPELVSRSRLIERLNEGLHRKLTLVSAPAGFGKTTLVSDWLRQLDISAVWLSLDEGDNDPVRFLTYFVAALGTIEANIGKGALSVLQSPQPPPAEAILTSLLNEIAGLPNRIILVLDDYHLIEAKPIHGILTFLLEHLPPHTDPGGQRQGMHLVIATREDPPMPLARLRARGQLTELRATDLRFTASEAAEFLNQVMGLNLSAEDIAALETRTEGWITGLQLAAISMQGREDATSFIRSFTGSHHYVLDYLIEEVLERQSKSVQTFLLQTAILNQLTGSLCDALTGRDNGQATLEMLEHTNLFIIPLDEERRWYRYHHLFAELLQQRLKIAHPNLINDLHSKAVVWHKTNGNFSQAIHHALARDDIKTATRLIEKGAFEALERSELRFILKWVDRLPDTALDSSPWLFIYHAWALVLTGQIEGVSSRLENIDWIPNAIEENGKTKKREMLGFIAGLKAILALWQRDLKNGVDFAKQALEYLPENNWIRGYCAIVMASSLSGNGNLNAAKDAYAESYSVGKASGNKMLAVSAACNLAHVLELEGHLQRAVKLFRDTFQMAEQDGTVLPVAGYIHVDLARPLYELNDLDAASQHLKEGRAEKIGHCLLARVQLAQGKHASVLDSIQKAQDADPSPSTPFDLRGGEYPQIRLWLKEKKFTDLGEWLKQSGANVDDVPFFKTKLTYTMHARALIALGREYPEDTYLNDALGLLEELLEMAENNGWGSKVIEIIALQALALQVEGDTAQAVTTLERALTLAEPGGYIRIFVDEGPPMATLLTRLKDEGGRMKKYVRKLLAAFADKEFQPPSLSPQPLIEPLSERELEVLQLLADGLTNPEIATKLFLSLNTVKVHTRNIYSKLDAHNRTQAVAQARALGILSPI